jgi:chromosome segregation ATPase
MLKNEYKNLEELLKEVQATRGLDTNIEFITHVQDLIGHSNYEELEALSHEYKETFYRVYDEAEGIEATIRFFAAYSKFSHQLNEELANAEADRDKANALLKMEKDSHLATAKERNQLQAENIRTTAELNDLKNENQELRDQLTKLKAKLYDLMTK